MGLQSNRGEDRQTSGQRDGYRHIKSSFPFETRSRWKQDIVTNSLWPKLKQYMKLRFL